MRRTVAWMGLWILSCVAYFLSKGVEQYKVKLAPKCTPSAVMIGRRVNNLKHLPSYEEMLLTLGAGMVQVDPPAEIEYMEVPKQLASLTKSLGHVMHQLISPLFLYMAEYW